MSTEQKLPELKSLWVDKGSRNVREVYIVYKHRRGLGMMIGHKDVVTGVSEHDLFRFFFQIYKPLVAIDVESVWVDKNNHSISATVTQVSSGRVWFIVKDNENMDEGTDGLDVLTFLDTYELLKTLNDIEIKKDSDELEVSRRWVGRDENKGEVSIFAANFRINTIWFDCKNGGGRSDVSVAEFLTTYKPKEQRYYIAEQTWTGTSDSFDETYDAVMNRINKYEIAKESFLDDTPAQTPMTSDIRKDSHHYYVTYDLKRYGRRGLSKGRVFICFDSQSEFSVLETEKVIRHILKNQKIKYKDLVVSNWKAISKSEFERAH